MAVEYLERPPRIQPELPVDVVEIPDPPAPQEASAQNMISLVLPLVAIFGFVFMAGGGRGILVVVPMALGGILGVAAALYESRQQGKEFAVKKKAYLELLAQMRQDMTRTHNTQRSYYQNTYPDVGVILEVAARQENSRFGSRLWERRPTDADFGAVRLGVGSRPSTVVYKVSQEEPGFDENPLLKEARWLANDSAILTDASITIPLRPFIEEKTEGADEAEGEPEEHAGKSVKPKAILARHSVGIIGADSTSTANFTRAVLAHFAAFHTAVDTRLYVVGLPKTRDGWQWAEWLPHCNERVVGEEDAADLDKPKQLDQLCFAPEKDKVAAFWKRIKRELDSRQVRLRDTSDVDKEKKKGAGDVSLPFLLVVVDLLGEMPADSPLLEVASEAVVATINQNGPELGAAIIFLANDASKIPSDCLAMIEVASVGEKVVFRYTEVGLNTPRYLGDADLLNATDARQKFAAKIRRLDIRRSFGADLPRSVDLLQMQSLVESRRIRTVDKLTIRENWEHSMLPQNSEWLSAPIGLVSRREVRNLVFSAKEGGDGVHGMIAGTTGSGKSELLLTLVAGLAAKYDPRIVNFVLVDFKGGAAFEPFKRLPHVVDILTNLQANAVERMFVALQAVMDERSVILARSNAKDLVDYRQKVIPRLKPDDPLPKTFPHLFIIVDEFAEMIAANPDYRHKFESVTRLGRAFGVTLILATQRPAGVVTDQMRSNMKFRICLRVETSEDSKELLGRPDSAFLPNLGGRGYIQVGNDVLTAIQVARAGGDYSDDRAVVLRDVVWLEDAPQASQGEGQDQAAYSALEIAEALGLKPGELPTTLVDWVVGVAAIRARRDGVPVQKKPWPNPLPDFLSLTEPIEAEYLNTERTVGADKRIVISERVEGWLKNADDKPLWPTIDWKAGPHLRVDIGIVDNPYRAEQRLLTIDLSTDPVVIFGSSGRGKSTFLKTLMLALGAARSPNELHMYALDFARGGLKSVRDLPHLGATIDASEVTRVDQLMRFVRNIINERQERLAKYASLADYNAKNPDNIFAEVVLVITNFAEFKESFEHLLPELMALVRDGRTFGVYFVISATLTNDLGSKLYNLLTQRLTLSQADPGVYLEIVGSGAPKFDNVPGRGLVAVAIKDKPVPLEFQVGVPGRAPEPGDTDRPDLYLETAQRMERVWFAMGGKRPSAELPRALTLLDMFSLVDGKPVSVLAHLDITEKWKRSMEAQNQEWLRAPVGLVSSKEVRSMVFQAQADGVHGMAAGTTGSGKSELIQTLISAMAIRYDPRIVNFVLVDYKGGPTVEPFRKLPHCVDIATNLQGNAVERIFIAINAEMNRRSDILAKAGVADLVEYRKKVIPGLKPGSPFPDTFPHLFIIVDEFAEMVVQNPEYKAKFESITRLGRSFGVSLILATQRPAGVVTDQMRSNMKFRICLRVETPEDSKELLKKPDAARLPAIGGRGYVQAGSDALVELQAAWSGAPYTASAPDPSFPADQILQVLEKQGDPPRSVLGWLVGALALEAKRQGIPKQFKPWPDPLPEILPLNLPVDASYLPETPDDKVVLSPALTAWAEVDPAEPRFPEGLWQPWAWDQPLPLKAALGVIDDPFHSNQHLLSVDMGGDPLIIFGASGRGKTTFVKSLLFGLAAQRSPSELNIFALDFGRGGLKAVRVLPHCGATIDASQPDRVEALFRLLRGQMNERQDQLARYASLEDYNSQHRDNPDALFPCVIVVVDNFAEFKENYEYLMPELQTIVRDGRQFGIYIILTASQLNDIPSKLYNLLTQRFTLTMPDPGVYMEIVGRGALSLSNVPGRGLVAVDGQPLEFQVGVPQLGSEKDPFTRLAERMDKAWAAAGGKRPSAEIPRAITLLEMYQVMLARKVDRLGDLNIAENWRRSLEPKNQEWLSSSIGLVSSKEIRTMLFSAKAGGDGVHGMAAGTTGSGKSELIQTLISSMAIKYDPRIVNFVLVDYKGGPTVEPFRKLPHCVDIATNLQGNAVERIFIAINAEMNRRSDILAKAGVADLVEYRKKVIPGLKPGSPFPDTFPHLFIIVDEFAEMVTQNPEYKAKFESITRLGRSFGVSLILATQRPAGVVTDQMRSNMKFRICLRVETHEDSKEMLGRPDAATLPAIGGRGYIQVGGGSLTELQAAWSGAPYDETKPDPAYPTEEILEALEKQTDPPRSTLGWLVGALALEAKRQGIPKQFKPWPDPMQDILPLNKPVNAEYMQKGRLGKETVINPAVAKWLANVEARPLWDPPDWTKTASLETPMGIVDNTFLAEQRILNVDVTGDPIGLYGSAGRGKTTFLKSLMISMAAARSPAEVHMYVLDFGRGGLKALRTLPHIAGIVNTNEEERVERFMRMLRSTIEERQHRLQAYDSLAEFNAKNPEAAFPAILVVVDNVSEFKETYERYLGDLIGLLRDGRSFGVYFVLTATLVNDVPFKLSNLLGQKIAFTMSDPMDYSTLLGRGWTRFNDVPGRGLVMQMVGEIPIPLEFHAAVPVGETEGDLYRELAQRMAAAWATLEAQQPALHTKRPRKIEVLPTILDLQSLVPAAPDGRDGTAVPLGINDYDRELTLVELKAKGPNWMVTGPPVSGKTTTLRSLVLALARRYPPEQLAMLLIDPSDASRQFFNYGGSAENSLDKLPHVLATVSTPQELDAAIKRLRAEFEEPVIERLKEHPAEFTRQDNLARSIVVIIDHYEEVDSLNKGSQGAAAMSEIGKGKNLHLVLAGSALGMKMDALRKRAESSRYTLVLQDQDAIRSMGVRTKFNVTKELPPGRGFLVKGATAALVQMATPGVEDEHNGGSPQQDPLDELIRTIRAKYTQRARWSYHAEDLTVLDEVFKAVSAAASGAAAQPQAAASTDASPADSAGAAEVDALMASLDSLSASMAAIEMPKVRHFATVEYQLPADGQAAPAGASPKPAGKAAQAKPEDGKASQTKGKAPAEPEGKGKAALEGDGKPASDDGGGKGSPEQGARAKAKKK